MARAVSLLAALRQLACLGLPGKTVLPEALDLLRQLVGFDMEVGIHLDAHCRLVDAHVPPHVALAHLREYAAHFYERSTAQDHAVGWTTQQVMASGLSVVQGSRITPRAVLERSELYGRVLHRYDMGWIVQVPLRDGPRLLACLVLTRPFARRDYGVQELQLLELAQPWLCHALAPVADGAVKREPVCGEASEAVESGLLVLDGAGRLVHSSDSALRLLHLAAGEPLSADSLTRAARGQVEALWRRLARAVFAAAAGHGTQLPAGTVRNAHGFFHWRAYALEAHAPGMAAQVALHVERRLPLAVHLFRAPRFLALSARERDVCLALVCGRGSAEIAGRLGIKPSSVIHYTRSLYRRLNVSQAKDLVGVLLRQD